MKPVRSRKKKEKQERQPFPLLKEQKPRIYLRPSLEVVIIPWKPEGAQQMDAGRARRAFASSSRLWEDAIDDNWDPPLCHNAMRNMGFFNEEDHNGTGPGKQWIKDSWEYACLVKE